MKFKYILGLDQTGAVGANGRPRPLPAALLDLRRKRKVLFAKLRLGSFTRDEVQELLASVASGLELESGLILIDANLGVPRDCELPIHALLKRANEENDLEKPFGAKSAHAFFNGLRPSTRSLMNRQVEILTGAQSVFRQFPFQRNVSCGSYRVLRELALNTDWFDVWPDSKKRAGRAMVAEGFPTFYWQNILRSKNRDLLHLRRHLKSREDIAPVTGLSSLTTDEADAVVLSLAGDHFKDKTSRASPRKRREGWILGV